MGFDLETYIDAQRRWSEIVFGSGARVGGLLEHIRKELEEIKQAPTDVEEWVDVVILALDGAWRSGHTPQEICESLWVKQRKNIARKWPKPGPEDRAIEHIRGE